MRWKGSSFDVSATVRKMEPSQERIRLKIFRGPFWVHCSAFECWRAFGLNASCLRAYCDRSLDCWTIPCLFGDAVNAPGRPHPDVKLSEQQFAEVRHAHAGVSAVAVPDDRRFGNLRRNLTGRHAGLDPCLKF